MLPTIYNIPLLLAQEESIAEATEAVETVAPQAAATPLASILVFTVLSCVCLGIMFKAGWLRRNSLDQAKPRLPLGIIDAGITFITMVCAQIVLITTFTLLIALLEGKDLSAIQETSSVFDSPLRIAGLIATQIISTLLVLAWIYARLRQSDIERPLLAIGLIPTRLHRHFGSAALAFILGVPVVMAVMLLVTHFLVLLGLPNPPAIAHDMLQQIVDADWNLALILLLVSSVLVAPTIEEIVYRGCLQSSITGGFAKDLNNPSRWWPIVITSLIFAVMHLGALPPAAAVAALAGLFTLSMILGWLYERTGSLWPCIFLHMLFNAWNILIAYASTQAQQSI